MIFNSLHFIEKIYIVSSLITGLGGLFLGIFVYRKNPKSLLNATYLLMSWCISFWSFSLFICHLVGYIPTAFLWNKIVHFWTIFIPITFFHFILYLLGLLRKKIFILRLGYFLAFFFVSLLFTNLFIVDVRPKFDFHIWPVPGVAYPFFLAFFSFYAYYSLFLIFLEFRKSVGIRREQLKFIFIGMFIGFTGGSTNYGYFYNLPIPPIGNFFVFSYVIFLAYSIIKYRLMDINIVITRASIFLIIYTLILGVPIWVGLKLLGQGLWLFPMGLMGFFAILGPFIYFYIQKRAEDRLLKEQKSYQATLRQASAGMGRIKELNKLLNLIVFILTRTVKLEHSLIYMFDDLKKEYRMGASKVRNATGSFKDIISKESPLILYLQENHVPIIYEEIRQKAQDYKDAQLSLVEKEIQAIPTALIVPIYIENRLTAFVCMGKKESGKIFSEDDLAVFSILANQAALAIENAKFYEDMKITQQQLFQAEKMATIGTMADGLSHQINNRFHALGFIAGDALDTIKLNKNAEMSDKLKEVLAELEKAFNRVQDNVVQGGEVVQGLLKYSRKGQDGFSPIDVDAVISNAYEMAQFKIKTSQMALLRNYDVNSLPKVKGNFTQLQEVFFNLIDNAYDAMMQRKNEIKEEGYHPTLSISAQAKGNHLEMIFQDNGIGVKEEDVQKLFTPFFTTKLSGKKGTGLGLYVIRKIIEDNHRGTVEFSSKYLVGTQMKLLLPLS